MTETTLITPEVREWIGREDPPVTGEVSLRDIRRFCFAVGDLNPLYLDPEYARGTPRGGLTAPPLFFDISTVQEQPLDRIDADGLSRTGVRPPIKASRTMAGGNEIEFFEPIRPGDTITRVSKVAEISEKQGKSGPLVFTVYENRYSNQHGDLVAVERTTGISW